MIDVTQKPEIDDLESYKGKWRNCAITSVGSFPAPEGLDTKELCIQAQEENDKVFIDRVNKEGLNPDIYSVRRDGVHQYYWGQRRCVIQIPCAE